MNHTKAPSPISPVRTLTAYSTRVTNRKAGQPAKPGKPDNQQKTKDLPSLSHHIQRLPNDIQTDRQAGKKYLSFNLLPAFWLSGLLV